MKAIGLCLGLMLASGCIVTTGSDLYEVCDITADCNDIDAFCQSFTADWPDRTTTDAICTFGCFDDFDCPFSNGDPGACVDFGGSRYCMEDCGSDFDCDPGFACDIGGLDVCLPF